MVRVPSLRNVATTAPYFHDGSASTLAEAVKSMGVAQLDRVLTDQQISAIVAFLNTLTGTYRDHAVRSCDRRIARRLRAAMRNLPFALGVSLLLALLTWLLLRGIDTNAQAYALTRRAFDDYALAEASLHRDVLQARAGLLRDYDAFTSAARAMDDAVGRIRSYARAEGLDARPVDRLAEAVIEQEELMERFKTSNALLQNSLSYVGLLSTSPAFLAHEAQLAPATGALAAAILHLARDTSVRSLSRRSRNGSTSSRSKRRRVEPGAETARAMLAHARLLYDQLPTVDATLRAFIAVPSAKALEETRAMFSHHRSMVEAGEQRYRLLLYLVSLLLLVALVLLGLRLRARAIALRRRAALEHVIAENSTRLINCSPAETEARLKQVLGEFSRAIGADRAYVILEENPIRTYKWSRDGNAFPPGWPNAALTIIRATRRRLNRTVSPFRMRWPCRQVQSRRR